MYVSPPEYWLKICNSKAVVFPKFEYEDRGLSSWKVDRLGNFKGSKAYSGVISKSAVKRIKEKVDLLLQISPTERKFNKATGKWIRHRLSFMTLTIPSSRLIESSTQGYRVLLQPFIRSMQRLGYLKSYLFKYELQERGQAHWHLTTNDVIPYYTVRRVWNNICRNKGYYDRDDTEFEGREAPSTEMKAVNKLNNIQAYLVKYLSKNEGNIIDNKGRIWGCSDNLRKARHFTTRLTNHTHERIQFVAAKMDTYVYLSDYACVYSRSNWDSSTLLNHSTLIDYDKWKFMLKTNIVADSPHVVTPPVQVAGLASHSPVSPPPSSSLASMVPPPAVVLIKPPKRHTLFDLNDLEQRCNKRVVNVLDAS